MFDNKFDFLLNEIYSSRKHKKSTNNLLSGIRSRFLKDSSSSNKKNKMHRSGYDLSLSSAIFIVILFAFASVISSWESELLIYLRRLEFYWEINIFLLLIIIPSNAWLAFVELMSLDKNKFFYRKKNIIKNIKAMLDFIMFLSVPMIVVWFFGWLASEWEWLIWFYLILLSPLLVASLYFLYSLASVLLSIYRDYMILKALDLNEELTWDAIFHTINRFQSNWAQVKYLRMLKKQKVKVKNMDDIAPEIILMSDDASVEMAKFKEQIYDLQE